METILENLKQQIKELNKQDEMLANNGSVWFSINRENIRACMLDIKNVITTLETIK